MVTLKRAHNSAQNDYISCHNMLSHFVILTLL